MDKPRAKRPIIIRWVWELLIVIVAAAIMAGFLAPGFLKHKTVAREAEVKIGLHVIQLALERYAVDSVGSYPEYLIGGEGSFTVLDKRGRFTSIHECPDRALLSDPLLRGGYLEAYPQNPFARKAAVHTMQVRHDDPLRNGTETAKLHGTRFGPNCERMGSVLADFRYTEFAVFGDEGAESVFSTYADVEYPFFDMWPEGATKPRPFLPGQFFYKSGGYNEFSREDEAEQAKNRPIPPDTPEWYMLGGYGSPNTQGMDVLGSEFDHVARIRHHDRSSDVEIPPWTRSTMTETDEKGRFLGSPYGDPRQSGYVTYGSPNGIPDSIILVLLAGREYRDPDYD